MPTADRRMAFEPHVEREIVITRGFKAPRTLVFDAWTKPELFALWFGPRGWSVPECQMDVRPGGAFRYLLRGPEGREVAMRGQYLEVVRPERLVTTESFEGFTEVGWRPEDATTSTALLTERDGLTTWRATILYASKEVRDAALQQNASEGMGQGFDRLDELLATSAG